MNALGHQLTKRREPGRDSSARCVQVMTIEHLIESSAHRQRVSRNITEHLDRRRLANAAGFAGGVFDGLGF